MSKTCISGEHTTHGAIRVACASNTDEELDGHFGSCSRFLIYQVDETGFGLVDTRETDDPETRDDRNTYRAELIGDCQVLFVASIGGPAAARVVKAGVHPVKYPDGGSIRDRLSLLQQIIADSPPPWLARAMGHAVQDRVRFKRTTGCEEC